MDIFSKPTVHNLSIDIKFVVVYCETARVRIFFEGHLRRLCVTLTFVFFLSAIFFHEDLFKLNTFNHNFTESFANNKNSQFVFFRYSYAVLAYLLIIE